MGPMDILTGRYYDEYLGLFPIAGCPETAWAMSDRGRVYSVYRVRIRPEVHHPVSLTVSNLAREMLRAGQFRHAVSYYGERTLVWDVSGLSERNAPELWNREDQVEFISFQASAHPHRIVWDSKGEYDGS